jgi:hypothetical protein
LTYIGASQSKVNEILIVGHRVLDEVSQGMVLGEEGEGTRMMDKTTTAEPKAI